MQWRKWLKYAAETSLQRRLNTLTQTRAGLEEIIRLRLRESDHIEFKREYERRNPMWQEEVRADCAALATTGVGFLLIGIDESRDGKDEAKSLIGVENATSLKDSIEATLATGLSPPIVKREVYCVSVAPGRDVVVVRVEGEKQLPIEVLDRKDNHRNIMREAGAKRWLSPEVALGRRERFYLHQAAKRAYPRAIIAGACVSMMLVTAVTGWFLHREQLKSEHAFSPDFCGNTFWFGSISDDDERVSEAIRRIGEAIDTHDPQGCLHAHEQFVLQTPLHPGRHYLRGHCLLVAGKQEAAADAFHLSEELAQLASKQRPRRTCLAVLRAMSAYYAGEGERACAAWLEASATDAAGDKFEARHIMVAQIEDIRKIIRGQLTFCPTTPPVLDKFRQTFLRHPHTDTQ